jgi:O-methyltransferase involved in polyketide biosynthesis
VCKASLRPIEVSSSIAAARAEESSRPDALFKDTYAAALCSNGSSSSGSGSEELSSAAAAMDVVATCYIDESVQNAMNATSTNSIQAGDFRSVRMCSWGFV